jgi:large subunit ribosomal protein L29
MVIAMKKNNVKELSLPKLEEELKELRQELFKLRFSLATNGLDNPMRIPAVKKEIARVKTEIRRRELVGENK